MNRTDASGAPGHDPAGGRRPLLRWVMPRRVTPVGGMRGVGMAESLLNCTSGPYELNVQVRNYEHEAEIQVVGRVTQAGHLHQPVHDLLVGLVEPGSPAAFVNALTDRFGEFQLSWRRARALGLQVGYGADAPCVLVWSTPDA